MGVRSLHEFLQEVELSERTLRHWHRHGVVPGCETVDGQFGYTEAHVLRVRAVFALQGEGVRRLEEIARRLDAMTEDQMRVLVGEQPEAPPQAVRPHAEDHVTFALRDGVFLLVRQPTDEKALALVRRIGDLCGMELLFP